jgi:prepilin-type N-terminal cleavage/methylation domain-containing protein
MIMKSCKYKTAVTLIEMLIVVGIIAILAALVITTAGRIEARAKEQLAESTITLITAAVEQFRDYEYQYPDALCSALKFPLDCNDSNYVSDIDIANALGTVLPLNGVYENDEVWCCFLSRVPECRKTLERIASSLKHERNATINGRDFMRIIDPWGNKVRYHYYYDPSGQNSDTFPVITSAGPDGIHGNDDDISSR